MQSLYVHFPFCESRCHYCDFYALGRERTRADDPDRYETALRLETQQSAHLLSPELDTIFFGGGTPSLTAYDSMSRALEPLWEKTKITPNTEWTMEANPSSITLESFKLFRKYGINRVSMGVQAVQPALLSKLGRVHSREQATRALETVFEAGFERASVDLLCGVPGQTLADLEESLTLLTSFPIQHLSCYLLTLPPHHKMYPELPNEDIQLSHLLFVHDWLARAGFEHYEISNFARPGHQARHNMNYWQGRSYLGLGPSAHSYNASESKRWKNVSSLHKYASLLNDGKSVIEWTETLNPTQINLEKWMLALRLQEGFPLSWLDTSVRQNRAIDLKTRGYLEPHPILSHQLRLTPTGFALSDQVIQMLA